MYKDIQENTLNDQIVYILTGFSYKYIHEWFYKTFKSKTEYHNGIPYLRWTEK